MRVMRWVTGVAVMTLALPAAAQFVQYTAPGSLGVREIPTKERLEKAMEDARWHLGGLRVAPWFGIRNTTYYDDLFPEVPGKQPDLEVTAGAGLAAFLPVGSRVIIAGNALPEYQWWRTYSDRRTWNGRYGLGIAGYFNRLTVEVSGVSTDEAQYASVEDEIPVNVRERRGHARVELEVSYHVFFYASGTKASWRYSTKGLDATQSLLPYLDRDETTTEGGLRWAPRRTVSVSFGAKRVEDDFVHTTLDRSVRGNAPTVDITLGSERTGLEASAARFDLKPVGSSSFAPYRGTTGRVMVWRQLGRASTWTVYSGRDLGFTAISGDSGYYVQRRVGTSLAFPVGWRGTATAYVEKGTLDYSVGVSGAGARTDDLKAYGLNARFDLAGSASFVLGVSRTRYDSPVPGLDRTYTRIQAGITFGSRAPTVW